MSGVKFAVLVLTVVAARQMGGQEPGRELKCELDATLEDGTLRIGAVHPSPEPCKVRFGNTVHEITKPATVTMKAGSGLVFIYVDPAGDLIAGSRVALQCNEGCRYVPEVTQFPADSIPLFTWTAVQGKFAPKGHDYRSELSTKNVAAGSGIMITDKGGTAAVGIDPSLVSLHVITPPKQSSSPCSTGEFSFDSNYYYVCVATNSWKRAALSDF